MPVPGPAAAAGTDPHGTPQAHGLGGHDQPGRARRLVCAPSRDHQERVGDFASIQDASACPPAPSPSARRRRLLRHTVKLEGRGHDRADGRDELASLESSTTICSRMATLPGDPCPPPAPSLVPLPNGQTLDVDPGGDWNARHRRGPAVARPTTSTWVWPRLHRRERPPRQPRRPRRGKRSITATNIAGETLDVASSSGSIAVKDAAVTTLKASSPPGPSSDRQPCRPPDMGASSGSLAVEGTFDNADLKHRLRGGRPPN